MRRIPVVILVVLICVLCSFQKNNLNEDWKVYFSNEQVEVSFKRVDCVRPDNGTDIQYIYLRFTNKTNHSLSLNYSKKLWYNNKCYNCSGENPEYSYQLQLEPGEIRQADCSGKKDKSLYIFAKMNNVENKSVLSRFEIADIQVIDQ